MLRLLFLIKSIMVKVCSGLSQKPLEILFHVEIYWMIFIFLMKPNQQLGVKPIPRTTPVCYCVGVSRRCLAVRHAWVCYIPHICPSTVSRGRHLESWSVTLPYLLETTSFTKVAQQLSCLPLNPSQCHSYRYTRPQQLFM